MSTPGTAKSSWPQGRYAGDSDLDHLRTIHRHLFQDVYPWAGELRTVDVSKGTSVFALARYLVSAATTLFDNLAGEGLLGGLRRADFVDRASFYLSEVNALHPFREGNGRAQRAFFSQLARQAGWHIDWRSSASTTTPARQSLRTRRLP